MSDPAVTTPPPTQPPLVQPVKPNPSPSPSPSPAVQPHVSLTVFLITKITALIVVALIFELVFQNQCGDTYKKGVGMMTRIMGEFSKHKASGIILLILYLLSGMSSMLSGFNVKSKEERSNRIKIGVSGAIIDIITYVVLVGILLNKCRSPLWIFVPLLILGLMMMFVLTLVVAAISTK